MFDRSDKISKKYDRIFPKQQEGLEKQQEELNQLREKQHAESTKIGNEMVNPKSETTFLS